MEHRIKSKCICGKEYYIEENAKYSFRRDKKRVYPTEETRENISSFRCSKCLRCVDESVPGAEWDETLVALNCESKP